MAINSKNKRTSFFPRFHLALLVCLGSFQLLAQTVETFTYTGSSTSWTVPPCVTSVTITVAGAEGGGFGGGNGAVVTSTLTVTPGQVINMNIGGQGQMGSTGYGGGGTGHLSTDGNTSYASYGGGGASTVSIGGTPIIIAAGGGGTGGGSNNVAGGNGGCGTGVTGSSTFGLGGGPGTQVAGGAGGAPWFSTPPGGSPGSLGQGGAGGLWQTASGGGGGGGYYGGGGGGNDGCCTGANGGGGGGGGSSLVPAGSGCVTGGNTGNGNISISYANGIAAVAANTGPYCEGETIQLNGSGGVNYSWTGPGGFTSNLQNPNLGAATMALSGTYQLIVSDPNCPELDTAETVVVVNEMPSVNPIADIIICEGSQTPQINFSGVFGGANYNWTNNNINTGLAANGTGNILPFTGSSAASPTEVSTVIVTPSTAFCTGDPDTFTITVLQTPQITVSNDTLICENGTAQLSASAIGGTSFLFHWGHTANTDPQQLVSPGAATTYTVYAENQLGCVSPTASINVTVRPPLTGTISPWDTVCPGFDTDLFATVIGGIGEPYTFVWSEGSTYTGIPNHSINVAPAVTTDYTVTITDGCESTPLVMSTNVRVAPLPVPAVTVLNPNQCEPAVFDIVNSTDPTLSQYNYWLVNGLQQFLNQDTITTEEMWAGEYDVQLVVTSFEGCVDSMTWLELLSVDPKPVADFKYSPNPILMFNTQVKFTNYSYNGYTYEWSFEDGIPSQSTLTNVDVQFPDGVTGRYDVMLITTSELGCVDTTWQEIIVYPEVLIYAPNAFTPDGDEHNQSWRVFMEGIDVYDFELLIFDRWGEIVWESHDIEVGWDGTYGGKQVQSGTYTWIIRTKDLLNDAKYTFDGHINLLR